jgi:hypothetical protein
MLASTSAHQKQKLCVYMAQGFYLAYNVIFLLIIYADFHRAGGPRLKYQRALALRR